MYKKVLTMVAGLCVTLTGCATTGTTVELARLRTQASKVKGGIVAMAAVDQSGRDRQDVPVTFGQIFKKGDIPAGAHLHATLGGKTIPIQVDRKATNDDGSLRHAVVTIVVPKLPASAAPVVTLSTGDHEAQGDPVTLKDLLATDFDAKVSLRLKHKTLTADARELLKRARANDNCRPWGKQCNLWLSGPEVSEWIVGGPLQSKDGQSPHLAAYFYVRAYAGKPIRQARVNVVIENDWTWVKHPHNIKYDATLTVGHHTYHHTNIDHYAHTRWHRVLWWGNPNKVYARLNGRYIQASKAVSRYVDVQPTNSFLDGVIQSVQPMGRGDQKKHMEATGAQPGIGPLPRWSTAYLLSMDPRAFRWMLANDDAAGSYRVFYRDKHTGRPVSLLDHPRMTRKGRRSDAKNDAFPRCGGKCNNPNRPNWAHQPSVGFLPYMVTGDFYYLEQLQFWADWLVTSANPNYRDFAKGLVKNDQVRGQAWDLRDMANAAYITPDGAPLKAYFADMVKNNIAWYNKHYTDNPKANKLGVITNGYAIVYNSHGHSNSSRPNVRLAPWQDDFFTWMVGHLADLGFDGAKKFLSWKTQFAVGRMIAPGFCYVQASSYTLRVRDGGHGPVYNSFREVYDKSFSPKILRMKCGGDSMAEHLGKRYEPGDMAGYPWSATGYPANMQPALAAAVDAGVPGAVKAWKLFMSQPTRPEYSNYANFAVAPRPDALKAETNKTGRSTGK
jgi:hypothetical protein